MPKKTARKKQPAKAKPLDRTRFEHEHAVVLGNTGLSDDNMKKVRATIPATDWAFRNGAGYFYTESGFRMMLKKLGITAEEALKPEWDLTWVLTVKPGANKYSIYCSALDDDRRITVTVDDNAMFMMDRFIQVRMTTGDTARVARNPNIRRR